MAKAKRKNVQDTTLRNNRATRKQEQALSMRIGALEQRVAQLEKAAGAPKPRAVLRGTRK